MDEKRLQSIMDHAVETGELAGCSLLLIKDRTPVCYLESGLADRENHIPVRRDTIFRLYSQSKPITSAAVMYLIEQGKLDLMDEVRTFLPGFASQSVAEQDGLKPVMRPVRISDLLSMTSGLVYPEADASGRAMGELFEENRQRMDRDQGMDTLEANLALGFPGDMREYYIGAQILRDLGCKTLRLLTNNPDKVYGLSGFGMEIKERVPIQMDATAYDLFYLKTKAAKMGHLLNYEEE